MKKILSILFVVGAFVALTQTTANAQQQSRVVHYFHFNNLPAGTLGQGPILADTTIGTTRRAYVAFKSILPGAIDTGYCDNVSPSDTTNARFGIAAGLGFRARNPSVSMQLVWYLPTLGFKNVILKYTSQSSSTASGMGRQFYDYSLDSGATFITTGLPRLSDSVLTTFSLTTLDLSGIAGVNGNPKFMFRLKFGAPNTGASGNNRFDNFTLEATPFGLGTAEQNLAGYALYPNPVSDVLQLTTPTAVAKNISISDATGRTVLTSQLEGTQLNVSVAALNAGLYFVRIHALNDANGQNDVTMKFAKK